MGKILNMKYNNTIDSLVQGQKDRLNNPFYKFIDKAPTEVTFYNINTEATTHDEATDNDYAQISDDSPLRFNKIEHTLLYGLARIEIDIDQTEFGTESSAIEGECYLPPNTFKPLQNSYFTINYLNTGRVLLFKCTAVNLDTLVNSANAYKISYKLDLIDPPIDKQVVKNFVMVSGNIGTQLKSVVENVTYDLVYRIEEYTSKLRKYYMDLFFKSNVQTFVYKYGKSGAYFYDPFMIEFMIKNKIMQGERYEYISHQVYLPPSFNIDYDNTFFHDVETKNRDIHMPRAYATLIDDPMSLMSVRLEDYYAINYTDDCGETISSLLADPIDLIDNELVDHIVKGEFMPSSDFRFYYNIIISYMLDKDLTEAIVDSLSKVRYIACKELYYTIPIIIFCLEKYAYKLFKLKDINSKA